MMALGGIRLRRKRGEHDRVGTAVALRNLVDAAEESPSRWRAHGIEPPLRSDAVLAARDDLLAVADLLAASNDVPDAALASASWLAWSSESPICSEPVDDADVADIAARLRKLLGA